MAEACRLRNHDLDTKQSNNQINENFCVFNVVCVFISLVSILADLTTDLLVFAEYCKYGNWYWALGTIIFILAPNILVNVFSFKWHAVDKKSDLTYWLSHIFLVGLLERYVIFLHKVFICKNLETVDTQKLMSQRNDLCLLHFLYIFTGTVPQIILQYYAIVTLEDNNQTKVFALSASVASVVWGCSTYIYSITIFSDENFNWCSLTLKLLWHFCMLLSRIQAILLFTVIFDMWTLLPLCLHWSAMSVWIIIQNTGFCPSKIEETLYNVVMGLIYCFFYINLKEGHTRYRLLLFYTLMVTQNFGSLFLYVVITDTDRQRKLWSVIATVCVIMGTVIGMAAMILYYRFFHSTGPILWKHPNKDIELNNKSAVGNANKLNKTSLKNVRSFKNSQFLFASDQNNSSSPEEEKKKENNADKNILLDHWIARSGTPTFTTAPIENISMNASSIEVYTVENTPLSQGFKHNLPSRSLPPKPNKKKTICAPTELTLKLSSLDCIESSIDEITSSNMNLNRRRGICTNDELRDELNSFNLDIRNIINEDFMKIMRTDRSSEISHETEGSNKKTSSDSIDMDLDLSFSDINSSDINTFNENIVQKLCLSALKNIKVGNQDADIENIQRIALDILKEMYTKKDKSKSQSFLSKQRDIDTPTEVLSVHDYENMCAVNIAREAWGLRSWKGYTDIENWLHDGSVVRDRRRDTLTSGSSEVSSCISQDLKNAILAAPTFPKKSHTYSNVFVKFERSDHDDYANSVICQDDTFLAKPCVTDFNKDLNHLEPILEELDDLGDIDPVSNKKRLNSESSLVATIDEIRKATVNNSPRNLYHRREIWDSPVFNPDCKIDFNLRKALWKEPSKFDSSNMNVNEKENTGEAHRSKINKKGLNLEVTGASIASMDSENALPNIKNSKRRLKTISTNNSKNHPKRLNKPDRNNQTYSDQNNDLQLLWQIASKDSEQNHSLSLDSLDKDVPFTSDNVSVPKLPNTKKSTKNRPRRKFSILRERFEPSLNINSDEEALFRSTESILNLNQSDNKIMNHLIPSSQINCDEERDKYSGVALESPPSAASFVDSVNNFKEKRSIFMNH